MRKLPLLIPLLFLIGCASLYTGIVTLTSVVDSAMKDWASLAATGKTSPHIDATVTTAHDKYRAAAAVAQTALLVYKSGGDQASWLNALAAVKAAAGDLVNIIAPLVTPSEGANLSTKLSKASVL